MEGKSSTSHYLMVSFSVVLVKQSLDTVAVIRVNVSEILHLVEGKFNRGYRMK